MGKTSKPVWYLVEDSLVDLESYQSLKAQGHKIQPLSTATTEDLQNSDGIHSPRAWRMTPELVKYLPAALKATRGAVYHKKEASNGRDDTDESGTPGRVTPDFS